MTRILWARCPSGRRWLSLYWGSRVFALGFGPDVFLERIQVGYKLVWYSRRAEHIRDWRAICEFDAAMRRLHPDP